MDLKTKVVLPCSVEDKEGLLQWTKDDFGLGTKRDLPGYSSLDRLASSGALYVMMRHLRPAGFLHMYEGFNAH